MEITRGPAVVELPERPYAGIRLVTPFRGMFAVRDRLMAELYAWFDEQGRPAGTAFFRLHVVDMDGPMDVEVGALTDAAVPAGPRVRPGALPAGRYATMAYVNHGLRANKALWQWMADQGVTPACTPTPQGDRFGGRYEAYLTDPRTERKKTLWEVELGFLLA